jgi:hypothetical protein
MKTFIYIYQYYTSTYSLIGFLIKNKSSFQKNFYFKTMEKIKNLKNLTKMAQKKRVNKIFKKEL